MKCVIDNMKPEYISNPVLTMDQIIALKTTTFPEIQEAQVYPVLCVQPDWRRSDGRL